MSMGVPADSFMLDFWASLPDLPGLAAMRGLCHGYMISQDVNPCGSRELHWTPAGWRVSRPQRQEGQALAIARPS